MIEKEMLLETWENELSGTLNHYQAEAMKEVRVFFEELSGAFETFRAELEDAENEIRDLKLALDDADKKTNELDSEIEGLQELTDVQDDQISNFKRTIKKYQENNDQLITNVNMLEQLCSDLNNKYKGSALNGAIMGSTITTMFLALVWWLIQ